MSSGAQSLLCASSSAYNVPMTAVSMPTGNDPADLALPRLREDIQLLPGPEALNGSPSWAIFDPVRHRYFRISWVAFELLSRWRAGSAEALVRLVQSETTCPIALNDVRQLMTFLYASNLTLKSASGQSQDYTVQHNASRPDRLKWLFQNYLFLRVPLLHPDTFFQRVIRYLDPLFSSTLRNVLLALGILSVFLISRQWETFSTTFIDFFSREGVIYFALGIVFVKICHELGHALTATRFGCRVASMGVAFLVFFPVLYTDTTDVYRLTSRKKRLYVSAAGILTEFYLALICLFLWTLLPDGIPKSVVFVLGTVSITLTILINMNPFLRFDGYYFMADALGMENLQDRAFAMGKWKLRNLLLGLKDAPPEHHIPGMQRFLVIYAWATWVYRFFLLAAIATVVYTFFFKLLGLILFLGVLYTFIMLPIMKEIKFWRKQSGQISVLRGAVLGSVGLISLLLVFIPWRSSIGVAMIVEPKTKTTIFAPAPGRIASVQVSVGDRVGAGQSLLILESPSLDEELRMTEIRGNVLNFRLQRVAASADELEDSLVLQRRAQENQSRLSALQDLKDQLTIRSPIDGTIVELSESLHAGRWINKTLPIAYIIDPDEVVVQGLVRESDLGRILPSQIARFVPDQLTAASIDTLVVSISQANVSHLDLPYLASVYGGDVAVRQNEAGDLIPETSVYRLTLAPTRESSMSDQVIRGVAQIEGEPMSFARRAYEIIAAALVRGSAF